MTQAKELKATFDENIKEENKYSFVKTKKRSARSIKAKEEGGSTIETVS